MRCCSTYGPTTIPVGTVLENPYTRRVRMLVVASGADGVGRWQSLSRNLYEDFRHVFHEEPGLLTGVGVLTDTDNTGGRSKPGTATSGSVPRSA